MIAHPVGETAPVIKFDSCLNILLYLQAKGQGLPLQSTSRSCILSASLPIKLDVDSVGLHHESAASRRTLGTRQVQAKVAAITVLQEEVGSAVNQCRMQYSSTTCFMHNFGGLSVPPLARSSSACGMCSLCCQRGQFAQWTSRRRRGLR